MIFEFSKTVLLLIGDSHPNADEDFSSIPNIAANFRELKRLVSIQGHVFIPEENIVESLNEDSKMVQYKIRAAVDKANRQGYDLIVYYSGHGILSTQEYNLYLSTPQTNRNDLEIEGISIDTLKKFLSRCKAKRKIIILDCCHSGFFLGQLGDRASSLKSTIESLEGTFVITSAPEDQPAFFPTNEPDRPTYFTEIFVDIIENGIDTDQETFTLRDIYHEIRDVSIQKKLPQPQQSSRNDADRFVFCKNKNFEAKTLKKKNDWRNALDENTPEAYKEFLSSYPYEEESEKARHFIFEMEEEDRHWRITLNRSTINGFEDFLIRFPDSKYQVKASEHIARLVKILENEEKLKSQEKQIISNKEVEIIPEKPKEKKSQRKWIYFIMIFGLALNIIVYFYYKNYNAEQFRLVTMLPQVAKKDTPKAPPAKVRVPIKKAFMGYQLNGLLTLNGKPTVAKIVLNDTSGTASSKNGSFSFAKFKDTSGLLRFHIIVNKLLDTSISLSRPRDTSQLLALNIIKKFNITAPKPGGIIPPHDPTSADTAFRSQYDVPKTNTLENNHNPGSKGYDGVFKNIWVENNVKRDSSLGLVIHINFEIAHMAGAKGMFFIEFYNSKNVAIPDLGDDYWSKSSKLEVQSSQFSSNERLYKDDDFTEGLFVKYERFGNALRGKEIHFSISGGVNKNGGSTYTTRLETKVLSFTLPH